MEFRGPTADPLLQLAEVWQCPSASLRNLRTLQGSRAVLQGVCDTTASGARGISIRQLQLGCHTRQQHPASQELVLQSLQFGKVVVFCPLWSPLYILHQLYGWNSYPDTRWASALKRFGLALTPGKAYRQGCQWALQSWGLLYIREECTHLSACPRPAAGATWENSGFLARSVTNSTW